MNRAEHLAWAKRRALAYVKINDLPNAVAFMMSDLYKHPELKESTSFFITMVGTMETKNGPEAVRRWIEGFN